MKDKNLYIKTLDDVIDFKIIDQLHSATVNFSTTSLELKKLFFVLIGIAVPSIIKLSNDKLDTSLFVTLYILTLTFWSLDSFTYYYQEKLREKMDKIFNQIKARNINVLIVPERSENFFTIENTRTEKGRLWRSISNPSVRLYLVLFLLNTLVVFLFYNDVIK